MFIKNDQFEILQKICNQVVLSKANLLATEERVSKSPWMKKKNDG